MDEEPRVEKRKRQSPYAGQDRRSREFDYREARDRWSIRRDQRIVNLAILGLLACLGAGVANVGNSGILIGMSTLFAGLLAVPKFLEWDERRASRMERLMQREDD